MYSERVAKAVADFATLYGVSEKAYKRLQTLLKQIDDKVHNEFRYCSRGLKEFIADFDTSTEDVSIERLQKATHAVKNAFNDSVDLILGFAAAKISELSFIDTGKELILYIPNLNKVLESIAKIHADIAESRADITNRVECYKKIIDSEEFRIVVEFCEQVPILENNIIADYSRTITASRRFIITVSISVASAFIGLVGVIEKFPDFLKYLSKFFPSLAQYI